MNKKKDFFKEAIKTMKTSGTIMPSSRFLINTLLKDINFNKKNIFVEFGPGNGVITKQILNRMTNDSILVCFEINNSFINHLNQINDTRLIIVNNSAENIVLELNKLNIFEIDFCISSLPLTNIPKQIAENIVVNAKKIIKENGYFYQFQYSLTYFKKLKRIFKSSNVNITFEPLNLPPAFIYKCKNIK